MNKRAITFTTILLVLGLAAFTPSPTAQATGGLNPPPDGAYPNETTAEGKDALFRVTSGFGNTALGFNALNANTTGNLNTATGRNALLNNTTGVNNTADGSATLSSNTTGNFNTATGRVALSSNTTGSGNTANGFFSLFNNTTAERNTANGAGALFNNTTGEDNIALGFGAGDNLTTGDNNIDIGNEGIADEANTIRIGTSGDQTKTFIAGISGTAVSGAAVVVNADGQLGVTASSARFKTDIKPMEKASQAILSLKPVIFRYKEKIDPKHTPQFGLVAEEVAKVDPALVARDAKGEIYTVRYDAVNAMLLNEFLKEHHNVQKLETTIAQQQKEIQALTASLEEQASQIQRVSDQLELSKPAPRTVSNNP